MEQGGGSRMGSHGQHSAKSGGSNDGDIHTKPALEFGRRPNGGEVHQFVGVGRRDGGS